MNKVGVLTAMVTFVLLLSFLCLLTFVTVGVVTVPTGGNTQPTAELTVSSHNLTELETLTLTVTLSNGESGVTVDFHNQLQCLGTNITDSRGIATYTFLPKVGTWSFYCVIVTKSHFQSLGGEK